MQAIAFGAADVEILCASKVTAVSAGRVKRHGTTDVATLQTLARRDNVADLTDNVADLTDNRR